ncbi:hypothetical protein [Haliea atlantica]
MKSKSYIICCRTWVTGNGRARRMLIESAWSYRFPARQTMDLKRKAVAASEDAKAIAWRAQKRLCGRYRTLTKNRFSRTQSYNHPGIFFGQRFSILRTFINLAFWDRH